MKRSAPLKRGKPPRRKKPLPKSRKALVRRALTRKPPQPRFKKGRDKLYLEWIRGLPCICMSKVSPRTGLGGGLLHQCEGPVQACHLKSRGAGGADVGNLFPACAKAHYGQHSIGIKSWAEYWFGSVDELRRIAAETYPKQYQRAKTLGWGHG